MLSVPLSRPRAISGTAISASGSTGVPGTKRTRGSRCAWFESTGSRCSTAQPVIPSPKEKVSLMTSVSHSLRASTGISSRLASSAS